METNNILDNYFFTFDSDMFDDIQTKLYGFSISKLNGEIILSNNTKNIIGGCYILIEKENDKIKITQDELSSMYLYYYKECDYWAISNSFYNICKLLNKKGKQITVRNLYIEQYLHQNLHVRSFDKTMSNEIFFMNSFSTMYLTKTSLDIIEHDAEFETVDIFSKQGICVIDSWIDKWSNVIKSFYNSNIKIKIDLSGGFDSRTIFCLAKNAGINFNSQNINVYSKIGTTKGLIEHLDDDYNIAEQIANRLNFILNLHNDLFKTSTYKNDSECQYEILRNLFMFTHKEGYLCISIPYEPTIHLGGLNGEFVRRKLTDFVDPNKNCHNNPFRLSQDVIDEYYNDLKICENKSKSIFERNARFYLNTQNKSHYGACIYNDFILNTFLVSPFNDKSLLKLKVPEEIDPNIIFAIIIYRTAPEIFDIDFSSGRKFDEIVKQKTIEICSKYPKQKKIYDLECNISHNLTKKLVENTDNKNGDHVMFDVFLKNKELLIDYMSNVWGEKYANDIYEYAKSFYLNKDNFFPNKWVVALTSIIELLNIIK